MPSVHVFVYVTDPVNDIGMETIKKMVSRFSIVNLFLVLLLFDELK